MRAPPSWPNHFPKAPHLLIPSYWGVRISTYEWGGGHKHSIHNTLKLNNLKQQFCHAHRFCGSEMQKQHSGDSFSLFHEGLKGLLSGLPSGACAGEICPFGDSGTYHSGKFPNTSKKCIPPTSEFMHTPNKWRSRWRQLISLPRRQRWEEVPQRSISCKA